MDTKEQFGELELENKMNGVARNQGELKVAEGCWSGEDSDVTSETGKLKGIAPMSQEIDVSSQTDECRKEKLPQPGKCVGNAAESAEEILPSGVSPLPAESEKKHTKTAQWTRDHGHVD